MVIHFFRFHGIGKEKRVTIKSIHREEEAEEEFSTFDDQLRQMDELKRKWDGPQEEWLSSLPPSN